MRAADEASLTSVVAQIRHLRQDLRRLPIPQFLPPRERRANIDTMMKMTGELEALTREAGRLLRALDRAPSRDGTSRPRRAPDDPDHAGRGPR